MRLAASPDGFAAVVAVMAGATACGETPAFRANQDIVVCRESWAEGGLVYRAYSGGG